MNSDLFWCIISIIGSSFFSLLISFYFYLKGIKRKRLIYDINTFCIISDKAKRIHGLKLEYNSTEIENLYSSTITIKNIGNSIIEKQDVAPSCPISISTSGQFLKAQSNRIKLSSTSKITKYNLLFYDNNNTCNYIEFDFDYIPQNAIINFTLYYTGNITFNGDLKEGELISLGESEKITNKNIKISLLNNILHSPLFLLLLIIILFFNSFVLILYYIS